MSTTTTTTAGATPSRESSALAELYASWVERMAAAPEMDLPAMRSMFEEWHLPTVEPENVTYREVSAGGVPALWCTPADAAIDRAIIWTHGGGYVVGSMHSHRKVAGHLAKAAGVPVLVLDYRRAPEHPHPAPVDDAVSAYRWLVADQGITPEHIATTGDSAGGGLCTAMVLALRDAGDDLPAAVMPISPFYDMEVTGDSVTTNAERDVLVQREILLGMAGMFLGGASARDPLANPLCADLGGLPPMLIQVGGAETLLDDSTRFARQAEAAGVDCTVEVSPEMQHVFHFLAGRAREADDAIAAMAAWVRPKLGL